ncbi:MAG: GNAT family N-acetyltransferase [bacterium]
MAILVRAATHADAPSLTRNTIAMASESEGMQLDAATVRRGTDTLLADAGKGRVFVAEHGGRIVGSTYVTFEWSDWHDAWYWWIQSVYVAPDHRGQHVYSALYRAVQDAARAAGNVRSIRLYVAGHNDQALRAYRGHGMAETPYKVFEWVVEK